MNHPMMSCISTTEIVAKNVISFILEYDDKPVVPGQFFMVWVPGLDEIPMSVSYISKGYIGITFRIVGDATKRLSTYVKGDYVGLRGPYGNGYDLSVSGRHLFVGGGTGIAMITPAVEQFMKDGGKAAVIVGARSKDDLFFIKRLESIGIDVIVCTDDGSAGSKGFTTEVAASVLDKECFAGVLTCGPEPMMVGLLRLCCDHDIAFQASLERYMKCAVGICGQCCIGEGLRVCKEGPIFNKETLIGTKDFGVFKRDASGKKSFFDER